MHTDTVIGPPGTGKTTWLSRQVRLAVDAGETPMVISLTRAAAAEAAGRDLPIPRQYVSTLHAQAYRALHATAVAEANVEQWNAEHPIYALSGGRGMDEDNVTPAARGALGDRLMLAYQRTRAMMRPVANLPDQVQDFAAKWQAWKRDNALMDFTDLIEAAIDNLDAAPGDPTVLFVDEAQDLSELEMTLITQWGYAAGRLIKVGDPWQNLYSWRGTSADAMGDADRILAQSYRIPGSVHKRAIAWMERMPQYTPIDYKPRDAEGQCAPVSATWQTPEVMLPIIEDDLEQGQTVMLLASCEYMVKPMLGALRARGLPFHNPYRLTDGGWNPLQIRKNSVSGALRILGFLRWAEGDDMTIHDLRNWTACLEAKSVLKVKRDALASIPLIDVDHVDLGYAVDYLTHEAMDACLSGDLEWMRAHLLKSYERLAYPLSIAEKRGVDALRQEPRIIVGTIHSVKGGEADVVYLAPDLSPAGWQEWMSGRSRAIHRTFYVGLTRARESLRLLQPATGMAVTL